MKSSLCLLLLAHFLFIQCHVPSYQAIILLQIVNVVPLGSLNATVFAPKMAF